MSRESDSPEFSPTALLVYLFAGPQHEQSVSHLFFTHVTKLVMTVAVAVYALHEIIQPFGKLEIPCITVILMENV